MNPRSTHFRFKFCIKQMHPQQPLFVQLINMILLRHFFFIFEFHPNKMYLFVSAIFRSKSKFHLNYFKKTCDLKIAMTRPH
uniref:Putative ovule protein n=1 Tax=Solanum chacoense TaxID=4108 RepID=A0A0V0HB68_SOLCH